MSVMAHCSLFSNECPLLHRKLEVNEFSNCLEVLVSCNHNKTQLEVSLPVDFGLFLDITRAAHILFLIKSYFYI